MSVTPALSCVLFFIVHDRSTIVASIKLSCLSSSHCLQRRRVTMNLPYNRQITQLNMRLEFVASILMNLFLILFKLVLIKVITN